MKPPPSAVGICHSRPTDIVLTVVTTRLRGALGTFTCQGTAVITADGPPVPIAFAPLTRNVYVVPLVRPVTVAVSDVETPSLKVVQLSSLSAL